MTLSHDSPGCIQDGLQPDRLGNLWDMINYQFGPLAARMAALMHTELGFQMRSNLIQAGVRADEVPVLAQAGVSLAITQRDIDQAASYIAGSRKVAAELGLPTVAHRAEQFQIRLRNQRLSVTDLYAEYRTLREAHQHDLSLTYLFNYPKAKAERLLRVKTDWADAILAFPSVLSDIEFATDCYALENNVACAYHCMRVLEIGLKALASDVGLTFDLQQWQTIIDLIESKIRDEQKSLAKGALRNARLEFLSKAAREFFYFKEGWRNHVSHNRANYDEHQALSVLEHTRAFMNHLASQLSESP